MKKFKFRGRRLDDDELVYGGIFQNGNQLMIINFHFDAEGYPYPCYTDVEPGSVAQFVGYDADGKEVYDGDELDNGDGLKLTAKIINSISLNGDCDDDTFNEMTKQNDWKLKEN